MSMLTSNWYSLQYDITKYKKYSHNEKWSEVIDKFDIILDQQIYFWDIRVIDKTHNVIENKQTNTHLYLHNNWIVPRTFIRVHTPTLIWATTISTKKIWQLTVYSAKKLDSTFQNPFQMFYDLLTLIKVKFDSNLTYILRYWNFFKDDKYLASITSRSLLWNLFPNTYKNSSLSVTLSLSLSQSIYLSPLSLPPHVDVSFGRIGHLAFQIH